MSTSQKIFLIGFMGSGKSSMGRVLADLAGLPFRDMDEMIEAGSGRSIAQIFESSGESAFRNMEHDLLEKLSAEESAVIATGGGVPCYHDHMELMKAAGVVVYLKCSTDELFEWLEVFKGDRPLLKGMEGPVLKEWIAQELAIREPFYQQADIIVNAYHIAPHELLAQIRRVEK